MNSNHHAISIITYFYTAKTPVLLSGRSCELTSVLRSFPRHPLIPALCPATRSWPSFIMKFSAPGPKSFPKGATPNLSECDLETASESGVFVALGSAHARWAETETHPSKGACDAEGRGAAASLLWGGRGRGGLCDSYLPIRSEGVRQLQEVEWDTRIIILKYLLTSLP